MCGTRREVIAHLDEVRTNGTIRAKLDRATLQATVSVGESVEVVLTGMWRDGVPFTATEAIRVIRPGR